MTSTAQSKLAWTEAELARLKTSCAQLSNDIRDLAESHTHDFARVTALALATSQRAEQARDEAVRMHKVEEARRRSYLAQLLELKGNIRVLCRIRPVNRIDESKTSTGSNNSSHHQIAVVRTSRETVRCENREFEFDEVFAPTSTNRDVFEEALPMIESIFEGHHACIFAYGQTGSGKTHTMTGTKQDRGVNFRAVDLLFERKQQMLASGHYTQVVFQISNVEIYNESVRDLLGGGGSGTSKELQIRQDLHKGVHLPDCTVVPAEDIDTIWRTMDLGQKNRAQALTKMNSESSRSHSIFMIDVLTTQPGGGSAAAAAAAHGRLILVDLAGSERPSKSEVSGERLKEAAAINRSLSVLGKVIAALGAKSPHVPFRDSKLTYLLQDSMGAQNKVMMIVQTAPTQFNAQESMCTLLFGSSARAVQLGRAEARQAKPAPRQLQQEAAAAAERFQLQQRLVAAEKQMAEAVARAERAEKACQDKDAALSRTERDRDAALGQVARATSSSSYTTTTTLAARGGRASLASSSSITSRTSHPPRILIQSRQSLGASAVAAAAAHGNSSSRATQMRSFGSQAERFPSASLSARSGGMTAPPGMPTLARLRPCGHHRGDENRQPATAASADFGLKRRVGGHGAAAAAAPPPPPQPLQHGLFDVEEEEGEGDEEEEDYGGSEETPHRESAPLPPPPPLSASSAFRGSAFRQQQQYTSSTFTTPLASSSNTINTMTPLSSTSTSSYVTYGSAGSSHSHSARARRQIDHPPPPPPFLGGGVGSATRSLRLSTFGGGASRVMSRRG